jgi:hypothetical protein
MRLDEKFKHLFTSEALKANAEVVYINSVSVSKKNDANLSVNLFAHYVKPYEPKERSSRGAGLSFIQKAGFVSDSRPNIKTGFTTIAKNSELGQLLLQAQEGDSFTAILEQVGLHNYWLCVWEVTESEYALLSKADKDHFSLSGKPEPKKDPSTGEWLKKDGEFIYSTAILEAVGNEPVYVTYNERVPAAVGAEVRA